MYITDLNIPVHRRKNFSTKFCWSWFKKTKMFLYSAMLYWRMECIQRIKVKLNVLELVKNIYISWIKRKKIELAKLKLWKSKWRNYRHFPFTVKNLNIALIGFFKHIFFLMFIIILERFVPESTLMYFSVHKPADVL